MRNNRSIAHLSILLICSLVLCSCQAPAGRQRSGLVGAARHGRHVDHGRSLAPGRAPGGMVQQAGYEVPADCPYPLADGVPNGVVYHRPMYPIPEATFDDGTWRPDGLTGPWPKDEYVCDGGDAGLPAKVRDEWVVDGLEREDTIAHFDTLDGRTLVEPSNKVCIYMPRFAAVRVVHNLNEESRVHQARGYDLAVNVEQADLANGPQVGTQPEQVQAEVGRKFAGSYLTEWNGGIVATAQSVREATEGFLVLENIDVMRTLRFDQAEKPWLAEKSLAAETWRSDAGVQVMLNKQLAVEASTKQTAHQVYIVDDSRNPPKLRVLKVASTREGRSGDLIDFSIRFDNVGGQAIGNVSILDNLHQRLEYVEDSQQSSRPATFYTEANEHGSLVLHWDLEEPLEAGEGGVVHFRARVR